MRSKGAVPGQRTLFNYQVADPFTASTIESFRDQYRSLHGHNPSAGEILAYYGQNPKELERRREGEKR